MDNSAEPARNRVLLLDLENCPSQVNQLMQDLGNYAVVVVCYAQSGAKIPIDWIVPLTATVNNNKLQIVKMPHVGKNSADFGITFWAGALMEKSSAETHFDIVSNDSDLDYVVDLLKSQGRSAARIGVKKETGAGGQNRLREYCQHLLQHDKNRPVKKETLLNNIKSKFKTDEINPELIFADLAKQGAILLKDNKIVYDQESIARIASS